MMKGVMGQQNCHMFVRVTLCTIQRHCNIILLVRFMHNLNLHVYYYCVRAYSRSMHLSIDRSIDRYHSRSLVGCRGRGHAMQIVLY